jgi:predicted ATPase
MERITIENFLVIKKADFEVGRMNIIIGSQAKGKSIIAKLLYFFREFLNTTYLDSILEVKREIDRKALYDFEKKFPKYAWTEQNFNISYFRDEISIRIFKVKPGKGEASLKIEYSQELESLRKQLKNIYKKKQREMNENQKEGVRDKPTDLLLDTIDEYVFKAEVGKKISNSLFIPAGRSFFANLQKNVFSFLASNIEIDPFVKEFGSRYEIARKFHDKQYYNKDYSSVKRKIDSISASILVGEYKYEREQDWVVDNSRKINLSNASSGQQEALPMLLIMSVWPFLLYRKRGQFTFFIEEPEAHLFPVSQKYIMSLFAILYKRLHHNFVITTHSPYILTALNNMILTHDLCVQKEEDKVNKITDIDFSVNYDDVRAYSINNNGELISILDHENRLVGANVIDLVSDEFDKVFDGLLQLQMEN